MLLQEVDKLLNPGYLPFETGYYRLINGQWHIAVLTMMPGCKGKWVDWWFNNYILGLKIFNVRQTESLLSGTNKKEKVEFLLKSNPYVKYLTLGKLLTPQYFHFEYVNPAQYFNVEKLNCAEISGVMCAKSVLPDGTLDSHGIHVVRDTDYGCEMRSRFWTYRDTEEIVRMRMEHYSHDMCEVAQYLKKLIEQQQTLGKKEMKICKFCHSNEVVKNGIKKGNQYWLCKNCGHGFIDNQALIRMKYPSDLVFKSVQSYLAGRSLRNICRDIEQEYDMLPSSSTVLGWVKKVSKMALEEGKIVAYLNPQKLNKG